MMMEYLQVKWRFYCEEKYTFEVGGKNKGFEQIKIYLILMLQVMI